MSQQDRLYKILQLIETEKVVSMEALISALEVNISTIKRDIDFLRERRQVPIVWYPNLDGKRGYSIDRASMKVKASELKPISDFFLTSEDCRSLLLADHFMSTISPAMLATGVHIARNQISHMLGTTGAAEQTIKERVRIIPIGQRRMDEVSFRFILAALTQRQRIRCLAAPRSRSAPSERELSPQRLVYYRDNWYLDAWCHEAKALRVFSVDTLTRVVQLKTAARDVGKATLDRELGAGYGIFSGAKVQHAKLTFTAHAAKWVRFQPWHPDQTLVENDDGGITLNVPFTSSTELVMDIMRHGEQVVVDGPAALRKQVKDALVKALARY